MDGVFAQNNTQAFHARAKPGFFRRPWGKITLTATLSLGLSISGYFYKQNIDNAYLPIERALDSTYRANGKTVNEDDLRPLARLREKYGLDAMQMFRVSMALDFCLKTDSVQALFNRNNLSRLSADSLKQYLQKNPIDERKALEILHKYRRNIGSEDNLRWQIRDLAGQIDSRTQVIGQKTYEDAALVVLLQGFRRETPEAERIGIAGKLKWKK